MADESGADDGAIYSVWDRFTLDEVVTYFERVEALARAVARLRGGPATPELRAEAIHLRDHQLRLGYLPIIKRVLA